MIKQKITNEYKTAIIKDKDQKTKDFDGQNDYKNTNLIDKSSSPKKINPQELEGTNQYENEDMHNNKNQKNNFIGEYENNNLGNKFNGEYDNQGNNLKSSYRKNDQVTYENNNDFDGAYINNNKGNNLKRSYKKNNQDNKTWMLNIKISIKLKIDMKIIINRIKIKEHMIKLIKKIITLENLKIIIKKIN